MEAGIVLFIIFGSIFGFPLLSKQLRYRHEERLRELEAKRAGEGGQVKALEAAKSQLEQRVAHLESIVCSVDFELNAKLNRLARQAVPPATSTRPKSLEIAATELFSTGTLAPGRTLANRYAIERALGQGGMGTVYLARDQQLGELIALKVVGGLAAMAPDAADRLRREASAARRITHPNVVRLHDIGEAEGLLFLSMEYVRGQNLADLIAHRGSLSGSDTVPIARQIGEGLEAAHCVGVIHRDLKPANILIDEQDRVRIIDFGLARLAHLEGMTATNMIVGTVDYMAPEQIRGSAVDHRSDIYAIGAVLFHVLVGRPPFSGETPIAIGFAHCTSAPVPPSEASPGIDPRWDALVLRALAKHPNDRFQSVSELVRSLPPLA